jgi:hypothetical protein
MEPNKKKSPPKKKKRKKEKKRMNKWYWIIFGSAGEYTSDYIGKKGGKDDFGLSSMENDVKILNNIFKDNPIAKGDGQKQ